MSFLSSSVIQGCLCGGALLIISQGMIQRKPKPAMMKKVIRHPKERKSRAMMGAATTEPIEDPAPKIPCAIALSFAGNHSALLLVAPGQLPASLKPRKNLKILK